MKRSEILQIAKPVLFNTHDVRATLDDRKTVIRRAIKDKDITNRFDIDSDGSVIAYTDPLTGDHYPPFYPCRYKPGCYLYVRETWGCYERYWWEAGYYLYRSDYPNGAKTYLFNGDSNIVCDLPEWRPSIHMPKEAARIFLRVTDVRVERLQEITEEEARAEGCHGIFAGDGSSVGSGWEKAPIDEFAEIWDSTVKPVDRDKYGWAANPFVWVIAFERVEVTE